MSDLERELRNAVEDAVIGEPLRSGLAGRAQTAAMGVLHRHRIRGRVVVHRRGAGFSVEVILPPGPQRVQRVIIRMG